MGFPLTLDLGYRVGGKSYVRENRRSQYVGRRNAAWIGEIDVLAMFCPFVGENTSEPFQVSDELPSFHLHLELFDHDFVFG